MRHDVYAICMKGRCKNLGKNFDDVKLKSLNGIPYYGKTFHISYDLIIVSYDPFKS